MELELSTRSLLAIAFKHQMKIIMTFAVIMALGLVYIFSQEPVYSARASFLVKFGQGAVPNVNADQTLRPNEYSLSDRNELMQSYLNILQSYDIVYQAIDKVGFDKVFPLSGALSKDIAAAAKEKQVKSFIAGHIQAAIVDRSNIIELDVVHKNPDIAYEITDALLGEFLSKQAQIYNTAPSQFLQQRLDESASQRDDAQTKFTAFKKENNITDIDAEIDQLLQEKRELSNISFGSTASNQTTIANLITELETKKAELEATYRPESIVLKKVNDSLKVARSQLKAGGSGSSFSSRGISVDQRIKEIDDRIAFLESNRGAFNDLKQNAEAGEDRAKYFKQRVEDARLNQVLNQENISRMTVIDKPSVPTIPEQKSKKLLLLAFLMVAGFCAFVVAVIAEMFDDKIATPDQLERICAYPVIGSFSRVELE